MTTAEETQAAAEAAWAMWDSLSFDDRRGILRHSLAKTPVTDGELAEAYVEYAATVSPDWMAMSYAAALFLDRLCVDNEPEMVADFGSGFSSYVLRRYAKNTGTQVISVDTDTGWLDATRHFLGDRDVSTEGLITWDEWLDTRDSYPLFDVAFHDMASGDLREQAMTPIADRMRVGGVLVFDDAQHESHMQAMSAVAAAHGWVLACVPETQDGNGRFDAMCVCRASATP